MLTRTALAAALSLAAAVTAAAQPIDRRSRDEPEIVVEAGGRSGPCDLLRFTPDGKHLYAAGDDKVVRFWPYRDGQLDAHADKVQTLRWPAWREQRGGIKAAAVSADGRRVAVGGFGMRPSTVAVLDRDTGDLLALGWPVAKEGENFFSVMAVAFHPDDRRVGFGTADGSLWVWDPAELPAADKDRKRWKAPVLVGRHDRLPAVKGQPEPFNYPRLVSFRTTGDRVDLVSVAESGQVLACDVPARLPDASPAAPPAGRTLFRATQGVDGRVFRAALTPDGRRLAVAYAGASGLMVCSADGGERAVLKLADGEFARSLVWDAAGKRLAVGVGKSAGEPSRAVYWEADDRVIVFDPTAYATDTKADATLNGFTGRAEALAFHPDGRLAVAGGDHHDVSVWDVAKPDAPAALVRGAGRSLWGVRLSADGRQLGVQTARNTMANDPLARGAGPWAVYELSRLRPGKADADPAWAEPVRTADGWAVVPDAADPFLWHVERRGGEPKRYPLELDPRRDQAPRCYTFVPAQGTAPTRLIVGHYYGCSVYDLTPAGPKRVRLCTGHAGEVMSVSAAKDGTWFVSAGTDQTVAAWTLTDWPWHPALGAAFAEAGGAVVVGKVAVGGPAWEAGLSEGDVLDLLAVKGGKEPVYARGGAGSPAAALAALRDPVPGLELYFRYRRGGKGEPIDNLTTVRHRPLWKWFAGFDDTNRITDWVLWMWKGGFYHTSTHGDRLVGWHVNHPAIDGRPEYYTLHQFKDKFYNPGVINRLVNTRDLGATLKVALGENPEPLSFGRYEPAPVRLKLAADRVGADGATVSLAVRRRGTNPDLLPDRVEVWVNDHRYKVLEPKRAEVGADLALPADVFRSGENRVAVLTFNAAGGRGEAGAVVANPSARPAPQLVGLSVGINKYDGHRQAVALARAAGPPRGIRSRVEELSDLNSATKDAVGIRDRLHAYRDDRKHFRGGELPVVLDAGADRKQLLAALDDLARKAKADDQLVVFFAGHGDFVQPDAPGADAGGGVFVFCCPDYVPTRHTQTGVSAAELFERLAAVNCRKVVLLDACHSGQAAADNLVRRCAPDGQGPFVLAACDQNEQSFENPQRGHGLFTLAVTEALGPDFRRADYDADGALTQAELARYVRNRMRPLLREVGRRENEQTPVSFPREPRPEVFVRR